MCRVRVEAKRGINAETFDPSDSPVFCFIFPSLASLLFFLIYAFIGPREWVPDQRGY